MPNRLKNKDGGTLELPDTRDAARAANVIVDQSGGYWSHDKSKAPASDDAKASDVKPKGGTS
jgi:hypothetical protein